MTTTEAKKTTAVGQGWGDEARLANKKFASTIVPNSEVHETVDYDFFKFDVRNRPVDEEKVAFFMKKFSDGKMFMRDLPCNVDKKTMIVVEGQHRLEACKRLQIPVFFRWALDITIENVVDIQVNAGWKPTDYLHAYIKQGKQDYVVLSRFMKRYKFPVSIAISLLRNSVHEGPKTSGFYDGTFTVKNEERAHEKSKIITEVGDIALRLHRDRAFCSAMIQISDNPEYDHKRMISQLEKYVSMMVRQLTTETYIRNLEEIYNYKLFTKNKVRFI